MSSIIAAAAIPMVRSMRRSEIVRVARYARVEVAMTSRPLWLDRLHACDEELPRALRAEIVSEGSSAAGHLVGILEADVQFERESQAALHALDLLADICPPEMMERVLRIGQLDQALYEPTIKALQRSGEAFVETGLRLQSDRDIEVRGYACTILSGLGVRDERIFTALCALTAESGFWGHGSLEGYGDPRAISFLAGLIEGTLARERSEEDDDSLDNWIVDLSRMGGAPSEAAKLQRTRRAIQSDLAREVATALDVFRDDDALQRHRDRLAKERREGSELWRRFEDFVRPLGSLGDPVVDELGLIVWRLARVEPAAVRDRAAKQIARVHDADPHVLTAMIERHPRLFPEVHGPGVAPATLPENPTIDPDDASERVDEIFRRYAPLARVVVARAMERDGLAPGEIAVVMQTEPTGEMQILAASREEARAVCSNLGIPEDQRATIVDEIDQEAADAPVVVIVARVPGVAILIDVRSLGGEPPANDREVRVVDVLSFDPVNRSEVLRRLVAIEGIQREGETRGPLIRLRSSKGRVPLAALELWSAELRVTTASHALANRVGAEVRLACGTLIAAPERAVVPCEEETRSATRDLPLPLEAEQALEGAVSDLNAALPWAAQPEARSLCVTVAQSGIWASPVTLHDAGARGFDISVPRFEIRLCVDFAPDARPRASVMHETFGDQLPSADEVAALTAVTKAIAQVTREGDWNRRLHRWVEVRTHRGPTAVLLEKLR